LDTVEPWTGEDLAPQAELAAAELRRLTVDRVDPWDPTRSYPEVPGLTPDLEDTDPWARGAERGPLVARKGPHKKAVKAVADSADPWTL
jgi:hypothetical protein